MKKTIAAASGTPRARLTGVIYLFYFLAAIIGQILGQQNFTAWSNGINLVSYALYLALALLLYYMFKPVSRLLSLVAAVVSTIGCVIGAVALFYAPASQISPLWFFGPYCLLIGYLIFRSTFLPRIPGVLMMLAGVGWLTFLSPLGKYVAKYIEILGVLAEVSVMLWLMVKGVNVSQWNEQAATAERR